MIDVVDLPASAASLASAVSHRVSVSWKISEGSESSRVRKS